MTYAETGHDELGQMTQEQLDQLERQLIAALYAIWRAQGKRKKVVRVPSHMVIETKQEA